MSPFEQIDNPNNLGGREVEPSIGLAPDAINAWSQIFLIDQVDGSPHAEIAEKAVKRALAQDLPTYRQHYEKQYPDRVEAIMAESNPEVVAALDALVADFNARREEIAAASDWKEQVQAIWDKARYLLTQPKNSEEKKSA
jgi:hypothetical protein